MPLMGWVLLIGIGAAVALWEFPLHRLREMRQGRNLHSHWEAGGTPPQAGKIACTAQAR